MNRVVIDKLKGLKSPILFHRTISTVPKFFAEVISAIYCPDLESGIAEAPISDLERTRDRYSSLK
jgi:hypothetical protein